jgi:hypothetical protein
MGEKDRVSVQLAQVDGRAQGWEWSEYEKGRGSSYLSSLAFRA